jgi:hypothetical protein
VVQTDPDNDRAVAISVDGTTAEVDEPGCWAPSTTSSEYNLDGEHVSGGNPVGEPEVFGCQE